MKNIYNVHIYREMRLVYSGIDANSHEEAAAIARDKPTDDADAIDDCDGETFAALVDVQGDEEHEHSRDIDFEGERERKAAPKMLTALQMASNYMSDDLDESDETEMRVFHAIRTAMADAGSVQPEPIAPAVMDAPGLRAALTWLLDDLTDAGEDRDRETGVEYDSVAFARAVLAEPAAACPASGPTAPVEQNHN